MYTNQPEANTMATKALTRDEFIAYWTNPDEDGRSLLSYAEESLAERTAEFRNEVAMFGDGGPGSALLLAKLRAEVAKVKARLQSFGRVA